MAERIKARRPVKSMISLIESNCKLAEEIEATYISRTAGGLEVDQKEAWRAGCKDKKGSLNWMQVPFAYRESSLLNKIVRIRLLEILSDV